MQGVMIGYVRPLMVHGAFMESLMREAKRVDAFVEGVESEPYVDQARNVLVEAFMNSGREWLLNVDTDVVIPECATTRLLARGLPLISALINVNYKPPFPQIYQRIADFGFGGCGVYQVQEDFEPGELVKADATGAGCFLAHRDVFDSIPKRKPFRWFQHEQRGEDLFGEDVVFFERAKLAGYQLYIDTAVKAGHIKSHVILRARISREAGPLPAGPGLASPRRVGYTTRGYIGYGGRPGTRFAETPGSARWSVQGHAPHVW